VNRPCGERCCACTTMMSALPRTPPALTALFALPSPHESGPTPSRRVRHDEAKVCIRLTGLHPKRSRLLKSRNGPRPAPVLELRPKRHSQKIVFIPKTGLKELTDGLDPIGKFT